jgi:ubiquinone/menaquinone biosynthesis C-methylase UbiE
MQNPGKIMERYVKEGMTVLDVGCGPGFFSTAMAHMVGKSGRVIAADLQEGMLKKLGDKIQGTELEGRVTLHKSEKQRIGVLGKVDFVLAFYVIHELPNQKAFFEELKSILTPKGQLLLAEPLFFVRKAEFDETIRTARVADFTWAEGPEVFFSRTAILIKN